MARIYTQWEGADEYGGRQIHINHYPFTISGVVGEGFYGDSVGNALRKVASRSSSLYIGSCCS